MDAKTRRFSGLRPRLRPDSTSTVGSLLVLPLAAGVLAALAAVPSPVPAQLLPDALPEAVPGYDTAPGVTVGTRLRPEYDSPGIRLGTAVVHPQIEESLGYDSAVLGAAGGPSLVLRTHPSLLLSSEHPDESYGLYFDLTNTRTPALPDQGRTDLTAAGGTTIKLGVGQITLGASHLSLHQDRTDLDALPTDAPVPYHVDEAHAAYTKSWGRLSLEPSLSFAAWRFGSATVQGLSASQSYRDRDVTQAALSLGYEVAPLRKLVLVLGGTDQAYTATPPGVPTNDSTSVRLLVGMEDASDGIWHYRLIGGWERRGFAYSGFRPHDAAIAEADVIMKVDGMTTITVILSRSIEDAAQEGVAGYVYTGAKLVADYEWRRNVILQASGAIQHANLLNTDSRQTILRGGFSVTYLLNRHLRLIGSYDLADVRTAGGSATLAGSFVRSLGLITLRAGL
jgi:hypothetical protein